MLKIAGLSSVKQQCVVLFIRLELHQIHRINNYTFFFSSFDKQTKTIFKNSFIIRFKLCDCVSSIRVFVVTVETITYWNEYDLLNLYQQLLTNQN